MAVERTLVLEIPHTRDAVERGPLGALGGRRLCQDCPWRLAGGRRTGSLACVLIDVRSRSLLDRRFRGLHCPGVRSRLDNRAELNRSTVRRICPRQLLRKGTNWPSAPGNGGDTPPHHDPALGNGITKRQAQQTRGTRCGRNILSRSRQQMWYGGVRRPG